MRILVVDDAAVLRAIVVRIADGLGHAIVGEAATLDDARALASETMPDVILVDGRLAREVGQVVRALQAPVPDAAIFVIASLDETALVKLAVAAGARGAILRPVVASQMRDALEAVRDRPG